MEFFEIPSINRIRLEFKDIYFHGRSQTGWQVLIESDWNLKIFEDIGIATSLKVLIESDWNLKYVWTVEIDLHSCVLIESDWNLKFVHLA